MNTQAHSIVHHIVAVSDIAENLSDHSLLILILDILESKVNLFRLGRLCSEESHLLVYCNLGSLTHLLIGTCEHKSI